MSAPEDGIQPDARKRIFWDASRVRSVHADVFNVTTSRDEICLLFGTKQVGQRQNNAVHVDLTNRILLSYFAVKRLCIQLGQVIQEYEVKYGMPECSPTPASVESRPKGENFPVGGAREKADVLFQLIKTLNIAVSFERSFKIVKGTLLGNRFLLGFSKGSIRGHGDEKLIEICNAMGMPESLLAVFTKYLPAANYIHFGYEQNERSAIYKVYLEFWEKIRSGIERSRQKPPPSLLHIGLKWDVSDPSLYSLTHYTWHPWLMPQAITEGISSVLDRSKDASLKRAAEEVVSLALTRIPHQEILYLDVTEEGNPRQSFDINVYRANLLVEEIYPLLSILCRRQSVSYDSFHSLYDRIKMKRLGHLAGGVDREGNVFFTVYYGVEEVHEGGNHESALVQDGSQIAARLRPFPRRSPMVPVEEADDKANRLYRLLKSTGVHEAIEHSFKFLEGILLSERFLTGFKRFAHGTAQDDLVLDICRQIGMPEEFQVMLKSGLPEANIVLFAFEKNETSSFYKVYLEFSGRHAEETGQEPRRDGVIIQSGFKWDASDNSRKIKVKYTAYPGLGAGEVAARVLHSFYRGKRCESYRIVDDFLDLAGSRTRLGELLYFEASEDATPSNAFVINVYKADLRMAEIYPLMVKMAHRYSVNFSRFDELYERVRRGRFGHLSGGADKSGRDFLTVYFDQQGSSRNESRFNKGSYPNTYIG